MARRSVKGVGSVVKVEGCEEIERILRDNEAIETIVRKCVLLVKRISDKSLDDPESMRIAKLGLDAAKVVVDIHKFHVGVSTKTVESERMLEDGLESEDDEALLSMIRQLETATGEKVIDAKGVMIDGDTGEVHDEEAEEIAGG